ncbi:MAG: hypothetical protein RR932_12300 [Acinetobacter sp.]
MHPEQLFELFYKNVTFDMNPPGFPKWKCDAMQLFWYERFMNAYYGRVEPLHYRSWGEAPIMWLAGYRENNKN